MKCTDLLIQDHKVILRALDVLDHMADRIQNDQPVEVEDVQTLLRFLRAFADNHHQVKEESALFPEMRQTSAANEAPLRQMMFEHDQERSLVEGLEDALFTKRGMEFVQFVRRLTPLVRTHIHKEETILFPIADHSFSAEQDARATIELNRFKIESGYLTDLRRLEWAYLSHSACCGIA